MKESIITTIVISVLAVVLVALWIVQWLGGADLMPYLGWATAVPGVLGLLYLLAVADSGYY